MEFGRLDPGFFTDNVVSDPACELIGLDGNVCVDPMFVDPLRGDVRLLPGSPCIDRFMEVEPDPDGTPRDLGALPYDHEAPWFLRGDVSGDGRIGLADALLLLAHLFAGSEVACPLAGDVNDDEALSLEDVIGLLGYLFAGDTPPPPPFPEVDIDPTPGALPCG